MDTTAANHTATWEDRCDRLIGDVCISAGTGVDEILGVPRPKWAHPDGDRVSLAPARSVFAGDAALVPLTRHQGHRLPDKSIAIARLAVEPRHGAGGSFVWFERHDATATGDVELVRGSGTALTVEEAVELAHTLLDAVAVLTEPDPDSDAPIGFMPVDLDEEA
ncbi:hypothetical protein HBA53_00435 [Rhodococcus pyridinivorans]|uniref:hypothetical protein n=1 Tax=Rhodococcus pyridinivorans TaxID=103816 RepID=UPI001C304375|nr:hypothetical protein [Rhodococcus pyridinivorans]QXF79741.1 hypothetical protein HBA53_00435 [Rhodococcus pyridinivorans]